MQSQLVCSASFYPFSNTFFHPMQLLFLERLLYSAEIKYLTAYLLASAALKECVSTEGVIGASAPLDQVQRSLRSYVLSVQSASLVNAALCRSHRSSRKCEDTPTPSSTTTSTSRALLQAPGLDPLCQSQSESYAQGASKSALSNDDSGALQCKLLSSMSIVDLLDSSMKGSKSLLLRARGVSIFEKLQK